MSKTFWGVIIAIILVFVGIFAFAGDKNNKTNGSSSNGSQGTEHIIGNKDSGIVLVEYGDYECPYCQQFAAPVKATQEKYNDQIAFQFRNFPLSNIHPNAFAAARAAEAAALQNKFWEMHDALYNPTNWQVWTKASDAKPYFEQYAQQLNLNMDQFKKDFASSKVNDLINADVSAGTKLGVEGTPTFYLNGKKVTVSTPEDLDKAIDAAIAEKARNSKTEN